MLMLWAAIAWSIVFRFVALDRFPGIHGDETYLAVKVALFLRGGTISLRTGSDLYPDPISFGLSCIVQPLFGGSFWGLRLVTALSGAASLVMLYAFVRRTYGASIAWVATALLACMPTTIAYSRFLEEPSQTPLVTAAWLFAAFSRRIGLTALLGALALVVHPTNVFLAPVVFVPFFAHYLEVSRRERELDLPGLSYATRAGLLMGVPLVAALAVLGYLYHGNSNVTDALASVSKHLSDKEAMHDFVRHYPGLFTGATIYAYIVRPLDVATERTSTYVFVALFVTPVALSLVLDRRKLGGIVVALTGALVAFYALSGSGGITPSVERYALWMLCPHCIVAAIAWHHIAQRLHRQRYLPAFTALVCSVWLVSFQVHYFRELGQHNSITEATFATGPREPKRVAFESIALQSRDGRPTRIYAEDWWTYWTLKYLALASSIPFEVTIWNGAWDRRYPTDFILPPLDPKTTRACYVGYSRGSLIREMSKLEPDPPQFDIVGYGGAKVVSVLCSR